MGFLRTMWRYLKRAGRAIRAILASIGSFFAELIKTFFEGPVGALERLARKIIELLGRLLDVLRDGWLRIWQKAPRTPDDKRDTPGREALPLLAAVATVTIWYLYPLADSLDLSAWRFNGALAATWVVTFLAFRWLMRRDPPKRISSFLIATHHRTGLIWFERGAFVLLLLGWYLTLGRAQASAAPLMLALGYLVLIRSGDARGGSRRGPRARRRRGAALLSLVGPASHANRSARHHRRGRPRTCGVHGLHKPETSDGRSIPGLDTVGHRRVDGRGHPRCQRDPEARE